MKKSNYSQLRIRTPADFYEHLYSKEGNGLSYIHSEPNEPKEDKRILTNLHNGKRSIKSLLHGGPITTKHSSISSMFNKKFTSNKSGDSKLLALSHLSESEERERASHNFIHKQNSIKKVSIRNIASPVHKLKEEDIVFSPLSPVSEKNGDRFRKVATTNSSKFTLTKKPGVLNCNQSEKSFPSIVKSKNSLNKSEDNFINGNVSQATTQTNSTEPSPKKQDTINVSSLINNQNIPLSLSNLSVYFPFYETAKCSTKSQGSIKAYSANTYQGIVRNYNEDRVSIILNISKPSSFSGVWPRCSFFGIYDGHGGSLCADFLRDQLHTYVIKDPNFPRNPVEALKKGFEKAESDFILQRAMTRNFEIIDRSGSCAVVALIVEDMCYIANVGDSRAVLSLNGGKTVEALTNDHKPGEEGENRRIVENGGKVYQTQTPTNMINLPGVNGNQMLVGPSRVFPGRLSVSRTFGDVEAKIPKFGGIPGVVVATPELTSFKIKNDADFMVVGCDGIFDQLTNQDTIDCVWMTMKEDFKTKSIHSQVGLGVDMVMKSSLVRRTFDNVTVLILAFKNFENYFNENVDQKNDTISLKSSYYLYNTIENKEQSDISNYYCNTDPAEKENKSNNPLISLKNYRPATRVTKVSLFDNKVDLRKVKSISPKNRETMSRNNPSSDFLNFTKLNKVLSFEVNKKVVSPKKLRLSKDDNLQSNHNLSNNLTFADPKSRKMFLRVSTNKNLSSILKKLNS